MNCWPTLLVTLAELIQPSPVFAAAPEATTDAVIAAERAFAADAARRGWVAAFKTYAAPDGILFSPDPVNAHTALAQLADTPADTGLAWWPVWAGIARSGDLGFTTGPFTIGGDKAFGHFFTVWHKQPDGVWRWIYDGGPRNDTAALSGPTAAPASLPLATAAAGTADAAWAEVAALEAILAQEAAINTSNAYLKHLTADARLMGSRAQPAADETARTAELARRAGRINFTALGGRASADGDLVFTYGSAVWTKETAPRPEQDGRGHYVRIWQKRNEKGGDPDGTRWGLVFDEILTVPPPKSAQPKP